MSRVNPVHQNITVKQSISEARASITSTLDLLNGKTMMSNDTYIECDFGSLLKSRLLGEFWVSKATLPKKAIIKFEDAQNGLTKVTIHVRDTHKWGPKWGYIRKYEQALEELSESIGSGLKKSQSA